MHLRKLAQRRIAGDASAESLTQLSAQEVRQVSGAMYAPPIIIGPIPHGPFPVPVTDTPIWNAPLTVAR